MDDAFEERKKKHEDKWAHDEELRFKIGARRNKLLGLWAAGELGLTGPAAEDYAKAVVAADLQGADAVFRKLRADFDAAGLGTPITSSSGRWPSFSPPPPTSSCTSPKAKGAISIDHADFVIAVVAAPAAHVSQSRCQRLHVRFDVGAGLAIPRMRSV